MKKRELELLLNSTKVDDRCPSLAISVNGQLTEVTCKEDINKFQSTVQLGWNRVEISLLNKTIYDTKIDAKGNILQDLYVIIKSLKVNQLEILPLAMINSKYIDSNGNKILNTNGFMGFNGTYTFNIFYPTNIFIRNLNIKSV